MRMGAGLRELSNVFLCLYKEAWTYRVSASESWNATRIVVAGYTLRGWGKGRWFDSKIKLCVISVRVNLMPCLQIIELNGILYILNRKGPNYRALWYPLLQQGSVRNTIHTNEIMSVKWDLNRKRQTVSDRCARGILGLTKAVERSNR